MQTEVCVCTLKPVPYTSRLLGALCFQESSKTAAEPIGQLSGLKGKEVLVFPPAGEPY